MFFFIILFDIKELNKLWKKTFKTIYQLSCFLGHQVSEPWRISLDHGEYLQTMENISRPQRISLNHGEYLQTMENISEPWRISLDYDKMEDLMTMENIFGPWRISLAHGEIIFRSWRICLSYENIFGPWRTSP